MRSSLKFQYDLLDQFLALSLSDDPPFDVNDGIANRPLTGQLCRIRALLEIKDLLHGQSFRPMPAASVREADACRLIFGE